jgi:plasmid stability protein
MPNITIRLDEEAHRRVKMYAAAHRTSISDLLRQHIRSLTDSGKVDALASYSRGELNAHGAMDALGITCVEDLYSRTLGAEYVQ